MRRFVLFLIVPLLAGCSSPPAQAPAGSSGDPSAHGEHAMGTHLLAPTWTLGDWWTWSSPQIEQPYTSVLAGEDASDWFMATDNDEIAFFDARFDIASLGKVRKSDLAGSQESTRVEYFQFPLTTGKTWSTTWDGQALSMEALDVANGVAKIEARRGDGTLYAKYTYDEAKGYFGAIDYYNQDGTEVGFSSKITSSGQAFSKPLVRWTLEAVVDLHGAIPTGQATTYEIRSDITDVYVAAALDCTAGAVTIATGPPSGPADNRGYSAVGQCPMQDFDEYVAAVAPAQAETWGLIANAAPTTTGTLDLTIWMRTREEFAVGQATA